MSSRVVCKLVLLTIAMRIYIPERLNAATRVQNPCNSDFFQNSWALLKEARWGFTPFEHAAFAVRDQGGRLNFVRWPLSWEDRRAAYIGLIPPNAFAIVHTHPNLFPLPSRDDAEVAQRLGIPVYVLTRRSVSVTTGREEKIITAGDWNPELCK